MSLSRRTILKGAGALPLLAGQFPIYRPSPNRAGRAAPADIPPILFVHGNGDHAALWITTLWRMESNGVARDRMFAINFTDPLARTDDTGRAAKPILDRGSAPRTRRGHQGVEAAAPARRAWRWSAIRAAAIRSATTSRTAAAADVSHAVLCGMPNHGIYALG